MVRRRYTYDDSGEQKTVSEKTIPVLYDNTAYEYNNETSNSRLVYKAIIDGKEDIKHTDKVVVGFQEYNIRALNLVEYQNVKYIFKLEAEPV